MTSQSWVCMLSQIASPHTWSSGFAPSPTTEFCEYTIRDFQTQVRAPTSFCVVLIREKSGFQLVNIRNATIMSRQTKDPYVCEAEDQSTGRPATIIFLHGFGDDAEGIPLGT